MMEDLSNGPVDATPPPSSLASPLPLSFFFPRLLLLLVYISRLTEIYQNCSPFFQMDLSCACTSFRDASLAGASAQCQYIAFEFSRKNPFLTLKDASIPVVPGGLLVRTRHIRPGLSIDSDGKSSFATLSPRDIELHTRSCNYLRHRAWTASLPSISVFTFCSQVDSTKG